MLKNRLLDHINSELQSIDWISVYERHIDCISWDWSEICHLILLVLYRDELNGNGKNSPRLNTMYMMLKDPEEQKTILPLQLLYIIQFLEECAKASHSPCSFQKGLYI